MADCDFRIVRLASEAPDKALLKSICHCEERNDAVFPPQGSGYDDDGARDQQGM